MSWASKSQGDTDPIWPRVWGGTGAGNEGWVDPQGAEECGQSSQPLLGAHTWAPEAGKVALASLACPSGHPFPLRRALALSLPASSILSSPAVFLNTPSRPESPLQSPRHTFSQAAGPRTWVRPSLARGPLRVSCSPRRARTSPTPRLTDTQPSEPRMGRSPGAGWPIHSQPALTPRSREGKGQRTPGDVRLRQ